MRDFPALRELHYLELGSQRAGFSSVPQAPLEDGYLLLDWFSDLGRAFQDSNEGSHGT